MHTDAVRYVGSGLLVYLLTPILVLYGGLVMIQYSGPALFTWLAGVNSGALSPENSPRNEEPPTPSPSPGLSIPAAFAATAEEEIMSGSDESPLDQNWDRDAYTEKMDRTIEMDADGRFSISNVSGHITVKSWNRPEVRIQATKVSNHHNEDDAQEDMDEVEIDIDDRNGDVSVETRYPERTGRRHDQHFSVSVYYEITMPEGAEAELRSVSGHVSISDVRGRVRANSVSGRVELRQIGNEVFAKSVSGDVIASSVQGDTEARSVSGNVEVEAIRGDLDVHTTSGRIILRDVESRRIRAGSTSGSVEFSGPILPNGRYDVETMSGRIRLEIPSDAAFDFKATTFSGNIDADFPITLEGSSRKSRKGKQSVRGTVNGGGAEMELSAFSGNIQIRAQR